MVHVHIRRTGEELADNQVKSCIVCSAHHFSEHFWDVEAGEVGEIRVDAGPIVFHTIVKFGGFSGGSVRSADWHKGGQQESGQQEAWCGCTHVHDLI